MATGPGGWDWQESRGSASRNRRSQARADPSHPAALRRNSYAGRWPEATGPEQTTQPGSQRWRAQQELAARNQAELRALEQRQAEANLFAEQRLAELQRVAYQSQAVQQQLLQVQETARQQAERQAALEEAAKRQELHTAVARAVHQHQNQQVLQALAVARDQQLANYQLAELLRANLGAASSSADPPPQPVPEPRPPPPVQEPRPPQPVRELSPMHVSPCSSASSTSDSTELREQAASAAARARRPAAAAPGGASPRRSPTPKLEPAPPQYQ